MSAVGSAEPPFEVTRRTLRVGSCPLSNELVIARREAADEFERDYLQELMLRVKGTRDRYVARGDAERAGGLAQVSRQMVQRLLKKHRGGVVIPEDGD